jgi:hypothetical protein
MFDCDLDERMSIHFKELELCYVAGKEMASELLKFVRRLTLCGSASNISTTAGRLRVDSLVGRFALLVSNSLMGS